VGYHRGLYVSLAARGLVVGVCVRGIIHTRTTVVLLGAYYGEFIPKGYVGIVHARNGATMAGYSSALNTDFAPESAPRMRRSAIDAIEDAIREISGCALTM